MEGEAFSAVSEESNPARALCIISISSTDDCRRGAYLKVFADFAASFSSLFFWAGGVPVRLDAPESSFWAAASPGLLVFDPRGAPNIDVGPRVG